MTDDSHYERQPIGWSSGPFHQVGASLEEALAWNILAGGDAFEIVFGGAEELTAFSPSPVLTEMLRALRWRSLHLPWKGAIDLMTCARETDRLKAAFGTISFDRVVLHEELFDEHPPALVGFAIPVAIELADARKNRHHKASWFRAAKNAGNTLVFDIAHAFGRNQDSQHWNDFITEAADGDEGISHYHVSGWSDGAHVPLREHPTRVEYLRFLESKSPGLPRESAGPIRPIIFEGEIDSRYFITLVAECSTFLEADDIPFDGRIGDRFRFVSSQPDALATGELEIITEESRAYRQRNEAARRRAYESFASHSLWDETTLRSDLDQLSAGYLAARVLAAAYSRRRRRDEWDAFGITAREAIADWRNVLDYVIPERWHCPRELEDRVLRYRGIDDALISRSGQVPPLLRAHN